LNGDPVPPFTADAVNDERRRGAALLRCDQVERAELVVLSPAAPVGEIFYPALDIRRGHFPRNARPLVRFAKSAIAIDGHRRDRIWGLHFVRSGLGAEESIIKALLNRCASGRNIGRRAPQSWEINGRRGTTVLLTTHDLGDVEELCKRLIIINRSRIVEDGPLAE